MKGPGFLEQWSEQHCSMGQSKGQEQRMEVTEMGMLWYMTGGLGSPGMGQTRNEYIRMSLRMANIKDKMKKHQLGWFGHVMRQGEENLVRGSSRVDSRCQAGQG